MLITGAVPTALALSIARLDAIDDRTVRVNLVSERAGVACPACGTVTARVHSRYRRTLADLPWQGLPVQLCLTSRRFFCEVAACPQRIFAERFPGLVAPRGRRSTRLQALVTAIGIALGGEPGARLVAELGLAVSPDTLLRSVRALPELSLPPPRVLGIDDWAYRKGHRYGTVLVDLERHAVVDLLPDRNADTVADWLDEHPSVQVVSRDRGRVYAEGARRGAPTAVQVADRFHLVKNLGEALERLLLHERPALQAAATGEPRTAPAPLKTYGGVEQTPSQERAEQASQARHAPKLAQYAEIHRLRAAGAMIKHIAATVGVSRKTVYRYLHLDGPPERKRPHRTRHLLTPYEPFLRQRWTEGCHIKAQLLREVREQGYAQGDRTVYRFLRQVERELAAGAAAGTPRPAVPSPRHVATLLVQRPARLSDEERAYVQRLGEQTPGIATAYTLTQDFAAMVRDRQGQQLDGWLTQAKDSGLKELAAYARSLETDYAAVKAGLLMPWSNGQTEGQVNKLKLVKRQMYGRAKFDLLRVRVLHVA
jgi:transposase